MNKTNVTDFLKNIQSSITHHSPEILTGIGIAGLLSTTVLAVRATPKALKLIEDAKREKNITQHTSGSKLTTVETIKVSWKCYIPSVITGTTSIACLLGANSVHVRRNAALATAYKLSETALMEYQEKVIDTVGEKKEQLIKDKVSKSKLEQNPVSKNEIIVTEKGNTLCYDAMSGRYFKSDIDAINKAINELNRRMLSYDYISLNEFYAEIGLDSIELGDDLGWNIGGGLIEPDFSSQISSDGSPCLVLSYMVAPRYDYAKLM